MKTELGRVKVIHGTPPCAPGKCVMCGTTEGPFIDIGFDIDYYGVVYWCFNNCIREIANALDYYSPSQVDAITSAHAELVEHNRNLYQENAELKDALAALTRVWDLNHSDSPGELAGGSIEESEPVATSPERVEFADNPELAERKDGPSQQDNEQRSTDIQYNDSLSDILTEFDI